jgi:cupin 2 domain-containing protein
MKYRTGNLFSLHEAPGKEELIETLATGQRATVERIVSMGHASPEGFWYDDPRAEWVALLSGAATLEFEADAVRLEMRPGDYVMIGPHCRHRVAWTAAGEASVWLAVYLRPL